MVMDIINSALNLKYWYRDTHCRRMGLWVFPKFKRVGTLYNYVNYVGLREARYVCDKCLQEIYASQHLALRGKRARERGRIHIWDITKDVLKDCKIMILQEVNEPVLNMAVSKAATLLGAFDVSIIDHVIWDQDYNGSIFSSMADAIFVATSTHECVQRFANQASVPVMCMRSRTHASIQALSTVMAIIEEFGEMRSLTLGFIGPPHPVLNSYLLLCPMLGANIKFLCCCTKCPVTPLLYKASKDLKSENRTNVTTCKEKLAVLDKADVVIAGPTSKHKDKIPVFTFSLKDVRQGCNPHWIFFHSCPRGPEVTDDLFYHENTRTFKCFENMQFIAAALLAYGVKGHRF